MYLPRKQLKVSCLLTHVSVILLILIYFIYETKMRPDCIILIIPEAEEVSTSGSVSNQPIHQETAMENTSHLSVLWPQQRKIKYEVQMMRLLEVKAFICY